jgi:hypothetical protein
MSDCSCFDTQIILDREYSIPVVGYVQVLMDHIVKELVYGGSMGVVMRGTHQGSYTETPGQNGLTSSGPGNPLDCITTT